MKRLKSPVNTPRPRRVTQQAISELIQSGTRAAAHQVRGRMARIGLAETEKLLTTERVKELEDEAGEPSHFA